jgi:CBS domain-containing protein
MNDSETSEEPHPAPKKLAQIVTEKTGTLSPSDSVQTAGDKMRAMDAGTWPVAEGRKLVGMVTDSPDLRAAGHGHDPSVVTVGECMSRETIFCYEDQDRAEAQAIMDAHAIRYLPVVDRGLRIVGILRRDELDDR